MSRLRYALAAVTVALVFAGLSAAALTSTPAGAQATPIQHVVVLYLENHSFDSILGFWCDANPGRCPDGGMPATVTLGNGATVTPFTDPDTVPNVDHSVAGQTAAIDGGKMDGWWKVAGCGPPSYACVSGYQPSQIPNATAAATSFAISDATFSMQDSPSWGGHLYAVAATTDGFWGNNPWCLKGSTCTAGWGCSSGKVTQYGVYPKAVLAPSCIPDPSLSLPNGGAFKPTPAQFTPTIMDRLDAAGLTWRIYNSAKHTASTSAFWSVCPSFAECADTAQVSNWVPYSQFTTAAATGTLPSFSLITPGGATAGDSEHNGNSMTQGDNWVGQVITSVETSPEWDSTALFITWDDCGCFYDQVPPPHNAEGIQEGPRTPLIIVSPYAKAGYTDATPTTFAGILAYTEQTFGLAPLGAEDAAAYAFGNAFDYAQTPLHPVRMVSRPLPASAYHLSPAADNDDT